MLHMVVLTHGPDTCAAAHTEYGDMAREAMAHKDEASKKHGVTIQGAWLDAPVVRDGNLITARKPADLPRFNKTIIQALQE